MTYMFIYMGTNEKIAVKVQWLNKYFLDKDVA